MKRIFLSFFLLHLIGRLAGSEETAATLFDLNAIKDQSSLETKVLSDWQPVPGEPTLRQKSIEISVCEWWAGRTVRIPVTLNAPIKGPACVNILIENMDLTNQAATPRGVALTLLKDHGVGVVLVGMGRIDEMAPAGELYLEMQRHLLETKDVRYSATWIWGMSQMRGLTAAMAEPEVFQPHKVLATGGSKRGIASAIAGIWDDRFTAVMPVIAPPLGNPGGSMVIGTDPAEITDANQKFFVDLAAGRLGLDQAIRTALNERTKSWSMERITLEQAKAAGWTQTEIDSLSDRLWGMCTVAKHLPRVQGKNLEYFYNVGTNDSVTPALRELGQQRPDFPIYIVPGGQHGGPGAAGYTRRVPLQPEVQANLYAFALHHFFGSRKMLLPPTISSAWDLEKKSLMVDAIFPDGSEPEANTLWWCVNKHLPRTLRAEYDTFESVPMKKIGRGHFQSEVTISTLVSRIDFVTVHTHTENKLPLTISSPYQHVP